MEQTAHSPRSSAIIEARQTFVHELRPAINLHAKTQEFKRLLIQYKSTLNSAADSNLKGEVVDSAQKLIQLREQKKTTNPGDNSNLDPEIEAERGRLYNWLNENFGGTTVLINQYLPEDQKKAYRDLVADNLSSWIASQDSLGKVNREQSQNNSLAKMAGFMLEHSPHFTAVREKRESEGIELDMPTWLENEQAIDTLVAASRADEEIARLNPEVGFFEARRWIAQTSKEARRGRVEIGRERKLRKIYETPYYKNLIEKLLLKSRKKNGVAGVILSGPPGTGKTELIQEKNAQEGYETHVVNIHHYTSFADLLADKAITLKTDIGAPVAQKLDIIINHFKSQTASSFGRAMEEVHAAAVSSGKISPDIDISQFLLSFLDLKKPEVIDTLAKDGLTDSDWGVIRDAFIAKQEARLLQTALPPSLQETTEDIVRGEILLAIRKSKGTGRKIRVLLDEIDKGGPNAYGGLLTFLSKSPGEKISIGNVTEEIPSWFIVDATSNTTELNPYLSDRFSQLEVSTPPPKDQLMIAAVRLSDDEGNLKLNGYEQEQVVAFTNYVIPEVNDLLLETGYAPLSNRSLQEFCSYLVDFRNMERTNISVRRAVEMVLLETNEWAGNEEVSQRISQLLNKYEKVLTRKTLDIIRRNRDRSSRADLSTRYEQTLSQTADSPIIKAIAGLPDYESKDEEPEVVEVILQPHQIRQITTYLEDSGETPETRNTIRLANGLIIGFSGSNLILAAAGPDDKSHMLYIRPEEPAGIVGGSGDGQVLLTKKEADGDQQTLKIIKPFTREGTKSQHLPKGKSGIDNTGKYVAHLDKKNNFLLLDQELNQKRNLIGIVDFEFSADGRFLLLRSITHGSLLYSIDDMSSPLVNPLDRTSGYEWKFAANNLLVNHQKGSGVTQTALFIS